MRSPAGSRSSLDADESGTPRNDRVALILCERGAVFTVPSGVIALACPLAGGAGVMNGEWSLELRKGDIGVGDAQTRQQIVAPPRGACIIVAATPAAWAALGRTGAGGIHAPRVLFPAHHRYARPIARRLVRLTRDCLRDRRPAAAGHLLHLMARIVDDLQSGFAPMIERCPGSSLARKKAVFLRLQRVRNHICACAHQELDVARLALLANYSVGHFITTFRSVFDETPYSTISRYRLESAGTLLSGSTLGIGDIAQATGYQSRSSFSRAIKKHFGSSASKLRESAARLACSVDDDAILGYVAAVRR